MLSPAASPGSWPHSLDGFSFPEQAGNFPREGEESLSGWTTLSLDGVVPGHGQHIHMDQPTDRDWHRNGAGGGFWVAGSELASSHAPQSCKLDAAALLKLLPQHHQGAAPETCPIPRCWLSSRTVSLRSDKIKATVHVRPHARAHACPCLLQGHGHPHTAPSLQGHRGWERSRPSPRTAWESGCAAAHPAGFPADLNFQLASCPSSFSQGTLGSSGQDGLSYQAQLNIWRRGPALGMRAPVVLAARTSSSPTQRALDSSPPMSTSRAGANSMLR